MLVAMVIQPPAIDALERAIAEVLTLEDLDGDVLRGIEARLGASHAMIYGYGAQRTPLIFGGDLADAAAEAYTPELFATDPLHPDMRGRRPGLLVEVDEHLRRRVHRSPAYADFYRRTDAEHYLGLWPTELPYGAPGMFGVFLSRSAQSGPFDARALREIASLGPALRAMSRRVHRVARLSRERAALAAVNGGAGPRVGAVAWDLEGRVLASSGAIERWLADCGTALPALQREAALRVRDWRRSSSPSGRWERVFAGADAELHVSFAVRAAGVAEPMVVAICEHVPHVLARAAELTPAERRTLGELARGRRNQEIAERLDVSIQTVKTHVKHVLAKLRVRSRSEAALIGAEIDASRGEALPHPFE